MKRFVRGLLSLVLSLSMAGQYCLPIFAQEEPVQEEGNEEESNAQEDSVDVKNESSDEEEVEYPSDDEDEEKPAVEDFEEVINEKPIEISNENAEIDMTKYLVTEGDRNERVSFISRVNLSDPAIAFYHYLENQITLDGALVDVEKAEHVVRTVTYGDGSTASFDFYGYKYEVEQEFTSMDEADQWYQENSKEILNQFTIAYLAFLSDYPEVFWMTGSIATLGLGSTGIATTTYSDGTTEQKFIETMSLYVKFRDENAKDDSGKTEIFDIRKSAYQTVSALQTEISDRDAAVNTILSGMDATGVYNKIKYLNDWLTSHCQYNTTRPLSEIKGTIAHECISALYGGRGENGPVCEGYAKAFKLLCDKVGIPCILESGYAKSKESETGESHAWNAVQINGKWYGIDPTWNDPVYQDGSDGTGTHDYFLVGLTTLNEYNYAYSDSHPVTNTESEDSKIYFNNGPVIEDTAYVYQTEEKYTVNFIDTEGSPISGTSSIEVSVNSDVTDVAQAIKKYLDFSDSNPLPSGYVVDSVAVDPTAGNIYNATLRKGYMSTAEITFKNCSNEVITTAKNITLKVYTDKEKYEFYAYDGSVDLGQDYRCYEAFFGYQQVENPKDGQDKWTGTKYCFDAGDTLTNIFTVTYKDFSDGTTIKEQDLPVQMPETISTEADVMNAIYDAMETTKPMADEDYVYVNYDYDNLTVNLYKLQEGETYIDANATIDYDTSDRKEDETVNNVPIIVVNDADGNLVRYTVKRYDNTYTQLVDYKYVTDLGLEITKPSQEGEETTYAIHNYCLNYGDNIKFAVTFVDADGKNVGKTTCPVTIKEDVDMAAEIQNALSELEAPDGYTNTKVFVTNGSGYNVTVKEKETNHMEGSTLTLDGSIGVNIYMYLMDDAIADSTYLLFTQDGKEDTKVYLDTNNTKIENDKTCYIFTYHVSAKELTDNLKVTLYVNDQGEVTYNYTVESYITHIINNAESFGEKNVNIAKALATYGDRVQRYFNYNTESLPADALQLSVDDVNNVTIDDSFKYALIDNDDSLSFVGARMVLTSRPGLKLYFTGDEKITEKNVEDVTEGIETVSISEEGKYQVVTISNIQNMENLYTIKVGDNFTLTYGLFSYGKIALKGNNADLKGLVQSMVLFNNAIKEKENTIE